MLLLKEKYYLAFMRHLQNPLASSKDEARNFNNIFINVVLPMWQHFVHIACYYLEVLTINESQFDKEQLWFVNVFTDKKYSESVF